MKKCARQYVTEFCPSPLRITLNSDLLLRCSGVFFFFCLSVFWCLSCFVHCFFFSFPVSPGVCFFFFYPLLPPAT